MDEMVWVAAATVTATLPLPMAKITPMVLLAPVLKPDVWFLMLLPAVETCPGGVGLAPRR